MSKKTERITARVTPEVKEQIEKLANKQGLSFSSYMAMVISEKVQQEEKKERTFDIMLNTAKDQVTNQEVDENIAREFMTKILERMSDIDIKDMANKTNSTR